MDLGHKPIRILHVAGGMSGAGGVQGGLMHLLRHIDKSAFQMDFIVDDDTPQRYEEEIKSLGGRVIPCTEPRSPAKFERNFKKIISEYGPYDIIQSHVGFRNGFIMKLAKQAGIPVRIAHSHAAFDNANKSLKRRFYVLLQKNWINRYATAGIAVSEKAAVAMFGKSWRRDPRWQVQCWCVIDSSDYTNRSSRAEVRHELGIPEGALVLGHVGRLVSVKNHTFMLNLAVEMRKRLPKTIIMFVGDGPLQEEIQKGIAQRSLENVVVLAGLRNDVPRLLTGAFDAVLLPSFWEGMPLVLIEAQAAGLPSFVSDVIAKESDVVPGLVHRLPLSIGEAQWADQIEEIMTSQAPVNHETATALVAASKYDVKQSVAALADLYKAKYLAACNTNEGKCQCRK